MGLLSSIGGIFDWGAKVNPYTALGSVGLSMFSAKQSRDEASRNRAFQQSASDTAYQRAMADMKKAGLNPILAGRYGPASTPSGSMATIPDYGKSFSTGMSTAYQGQQTQANVRKIAAEIKQIGYQHGLTEAQTSNIEELTKKVIQDTELSGQQTIGKAFENRVNSLISEFKEDNPNLTLFQAFGVDAGDLVDIIKSLTKKGK
jgi:hypothetical protein